MSSDEKYLDDLLKQITSSQENTSAPVINSAENTEESLEALETEEEDVDLFENRFEDIEEDKFEDTVEDTIEDTIKDTVEDTIEDTIEDTVEDTIEEESQESATLDIDFFADVEEPTKMESGEDDLSDLLKILEAESHEEFEQTGILNLTGDSEKTSIVQSNPVVDDSDIADLFSTGEEDEELAEINELLLKDENHELVEDDEMLMLLSKATQESENENSKTDSKLELNPLEDDSSENNDGNKKKNAKQKIKKEKRKKKTDATDTIERSPEEIAGGETPSKSKKENFLLKVIKALTESEEDADEDNQAGLAQKKVQPVSEENLELLDELNQEDLKGKNGKKAKKEKKTKEKKATKEKKPKKEKIKKEKPLKVSSEEKPEKKIPKRNIIGVFFVAVSFLAVLLILVILIPNSINITKAYEANDKNDYQEVYKLLAGVTLKEEDQKILTKAKIVLEVERKFESYQNHKQLGMELEAINDLFQGIKKYFELSEYAVEYEVADEINQTYQLILQSLLEEYSISEEEALGILEYDKVTYTKRINAIIYGTVFEDPNKSEDVAEELEDILPEERLILEGQETVSDSSIQEDESVVSEEKELFSGTVNSNEGSVDFSQSDAQGETEGATE